MVSVGSNLAQVADITHGRTNVTVLLIIHVSKVCVAKVTRNLPIGTVKRISHSVSHGF
jgi:hypothetical protein